MVAFFVSRRSRRFNTAQITQNFRCVVAPLREYPPRLCEIFATLRETYILSGTLMPSIPIAAAITFAVISEI